MELPIDQMTVAEKLSTMEALWEDLSRTPEQVPAPDWHGDTLRDRVGRVEQGESKFNSWSSARKRLLKQPE